jgi:hypothetical protein
VIYDIRLSVCYWTCLLAGYFFFEIWETSEPVKGEVLPVQTLEVYEEVEVEFL